MYPKIKCESLCNIEQIQFAILKAAAWLIKRLDNSTIAAAPIGLYFARLWYFEELYPVIFALSAMKKIKLESYFASVTTPHNTISP